MTGGLISPPRSSADLGDGVPSLDPFPHCSPSDPLESFLSLPRRSLNFLLDLGQTACRSKKLTCDDFHYATELHSIVPARLESRRRSRRSAQQPRGEQKRPRHHPKKRTSRL
uniref:Uncharacterized protein n=1 Tax=Anopheles melas TaxID=34690 RepID=A0A182UCU4_9DIPT